MMFHFADATLLQDKGITIGIKQLDARQLFRYRLAGLPMECPRPPAIRS
jgi:hypothetical protein